MTDESSLLPSLMPFTFGVEVEYNGGYCECCGGEGRQECYECHGYGRVDCDDCNGSGECECDSCGGASECDTCCGGGRLECSECDGAGDYECDECWGGSVEGNAPRGWEVKPEHCGTEFVSPPMQDVDRMVNDLRSLAEANRGSGVSDCGFHIHLCVNPLDPDAVDPVRFFTAWQRRKQDAIYPLVPKGAGARHSTQWCALLQPDLSFDAWVESMQRYYEVNAQAMLAHNTIEVRLGGASEDADELVAFLKAVLALAYESRYRSSNPAMRLAVLDGHFRRNHSPFRHWVNNLKRLHRSRVQREMQEA